MLPLSELRWNDGVLVIRIKLLHPQATVPTQAYDTAAGWDVRALEVVYFAPWEVRRIPLGFALEMPPDLWAELRPRSGHALQGLHVHSPPIDADYRGEICAIVQNLSEHGHFLEPGTRVAQLVFHRLVPVVFTSCDNDLSSTARGGKGFGSSGK